MTTTTTEIKSQMITGPAEDECDGDETIDVTLWGIDGDGDDWAFMVTASVGDAENFEEEGFDTLKDAEAHYSYVLSRTAREFKYRAKARHADHAEALLEATEGWTGDDAALARAMAKLIKGGQAGAALAALKAAGLA